MKETTKKETIGTITELPLELLVAFAEHPFKPYSGEQLWDLVRSIEEHGVLTPILVRPAKDGQQYEIISGHNRVNAARRAGLNTIPATVRELDDDAATLAMVESNLRQREQLLPSEKAFAYKMKLEAMRRKAGRPKKDNSPQTASNYRSDDAAAEAFGVSGDTMRRYVRLTNLIPELLEYMDRDEMALSVGEALSYLDEDMQRFVLDAMEAEDCTPSYSQAVRMKNLFRNGDLDEDGIMTVMSEQKANQREHRRTLIWIQLGSFFFAPLPCGKNLILWTFSASRTRIPARAVSSFMFIPSIFEPLQQKVHPDRL